MMLKHYDFLPKCEHRVPMCELWIKIKELSIYTISSNRYTDMLTNIYPLLVNSTNQIFTNEDQ